MGERMSFFNVQDRPVALASFSAMSDFWLRASAHVAWGVFNWIKLDTPRLLSELGTSAYRRSLHSLHYMDQGPKALPVLPIPGDLFHVGHDATTVRITSKPLPRYMGNIFPRDLQVLGHLSGDYFGLLFI